MIFRSVKYGDVTMFKMTALRHLEFSEFEIFTLHRNYDRILCLGLYKNFTEIGQSAVHLWPKTMFSHMASICHVEF